ncbi:MAG TPA: DUF2339 domain-containing protein [Pyrinomonadaceae bacterium]|jgi:uncharacterized membrane protein|nr:DUF2339 domain-containing protein [Pyrinomonadaceae bacterium]
MADDQLSPEMLANLVERLDRLEQTLQNNTTRLHAVEQHLGLYAPPPPQPRPAPPPQPRPEPEEEVRAEAPPREPRAGTGYAVPPTQAKPRDIEMLIGGRWFLWAGIIFVAFAVAFFLKLAFENDWIGPGLRVGLGAAAGLALLGAGEWLRGRGLRYYAFVISGGGVLILYLSIYAAYNFYQLLGQPVAFLLMALVTALAVSLSVRLDALPVAVLGLAGGFLTPALLSRGVDNQVALFGYVALLDAGVLAVAYFKRWRLLDFLSFLGTALVTLVWMAEYYAREKLWLTLFFLSLFFVLYALLAVVHNVLPGRRSRWFDLSLALTNAGLYYLLSYWLLVNAGYDLTAPATHAVLVSAFFLLLFYLVRTRARADRLLSYGYVGAAVTFFTVAVGVRFDLYWVTMAWAVEALMLTWVGLRADERATTTASLVVFAAAVLHWFTWDVQSYAWGGAGGPDFVPLLNPRALSCGLLVACLGAAAWLHRHSPVRREASDEWDFHAPAVYSLAANLLALTLLTLDLNDYFERRKALAAGAGSPDYLGGRIENARQFSFTALWTFYGATLVAFGARFKGRVLRYAGLGLIAMTTVKALASDLPFYAAPWHAPVFNQTFLAFALLVGAYALAARLLERSPHVTEEERATLPVLVVVANLLAVIALSAEALGYFESQMSSEREPGRLRDLELAKQLSLSMVWAVYGAALLLYGRARGTKLVRLLGLGLLSLTTLKVFFWDLSSLDRVYRIISFIVLGAILLAVSYLYQRSLQQQRAAPPAEDA